MKTCGTCKLDKNYDSFYRDPRGDGNSYRSYCIECHKQRQAAWRKENKLKIKERSSVYYIENREKILAMNAEYDRLNKETRGAIRVRQRERMLKGIITGLYTPLEIFERDNWTCKLCGEWVDPALRGQRCAAAPSVDHIIPLSKNGPDIPDNVQLAHKGCNSRKYTHAI